jgi:hypothetical protein
VLRLLCPSGTRIVMCFIVQIFSPNINVNQVQNNPLESPYYTSKNIFIDFSFTTGINHN